VKWKTQNQKQNQSGFTFNKSKQWLRQSRAEVECAFAIQGLEKTIRRWNN
jgi:hypothetical protein